MTARLYFDDADEGPAPATSHPRFVELAPATFYDILSHHVPFGGDDGGDALTDLEEWYRQGGRGEAVMSFLEALLENWRSDVPEGMIVDASGRFAEWIGKDHANRSCLMSECRVTIAVALGQLKIAGLIDVRLLKRAQAAVACLGRLAAYENAHAPNRPHAAQQRQMLDDVRAVLSAIAAPASKAPGALRL